jgi:pimeloyl-ACP methyl ester carboxylesterase
MKTRMLGMLSLVTLLVSSSPLPAATVDGVKIHSTTTGQGPKTVVLVHGWTCDETSWSEQVPVLSKKYRVITIDLPGHGQSEHRRTVSSRWIFSRRQSKRCGPRRASIA